MTSLLDIPAHSDAQDTDSRTDAAHRMRTTMTAARLSFTWFGTRKTLTREQKEQAADSFGAEGDFLSAGKKLIDTQHPKFKAVTSVRTRTVNYWKALSLPYPDPGVRLIRQDAIDEFARRMNRFKAELEDAVVELGEHYEELRNAARQRLGSLYSAADYPVSLQGLFAVDWEFPSVEPPEYLRRLNPALYEQECERVRSRFDEAVRLAEGAFMDEFAQLVTHLCERLGGGSDGRQKVFRNSAVDNLTQFFERFRTLNVGTNAELDRLVDEAQQIVGGVRPQNLRDNSGLRRQVATQLSGVQSVLDGLLVDRPRRNIIRKPR
jgi:hypothetical protein